jgi:hypothetical protein
MGLSGHERGGRLQSVFSIQSREPALLAGPHFRR